MYNKQLKTFVLTIFVIISALYAQDYYGLRYFENTIDIDALDPVYGRRTYKHERLGELLNAKLWTWNDKLEKVPDLVESLPDMGIGQSVYSIPVKLKQNLFWPDGKPLTVDDIIFSFELYGQCERPYLASSARKIKIRKLDNLEFRIEPYSETDKNNFLKYILLNIPKFQILPAHLFGIPNIVKGDNYSRNPVGAGPYAIDDISVDGERVEILLNQNSFHHAKKHTRMIREITMVTEPITQSVLQNLQMTNEQTYNASTGVKSGVDLIINPINSRLVLADLNSYSHIDHIDYTRNSWVGLGFNTRKPVLNSGEFRRLIDTITNDGHIIRDVYGPAALDISGPFNPFFGIYVEGLQDRYTPDLNYTEIKEKLVSNFNMELREDKLYRIDPESGKKEKASLRIIYDSKFAQAGTREQEALHEIKIALESAGFTVILDALDTKVYNEKKADTEYWDLIYLRHTFGWDNNITRLFEPDGPYNITGYSNPVLTGHIDKFLHADDDRVRLNAAHEIHKHCYDEMPYLFLWHVKPRAYKRTILKNMTITPGTFFTTIPEWEIEPR